MANKLINILIIVTLLITVLASVSLKPTQLRKRPGGRIIGGRVAEAAQFPFMASVYTSTSDGTYFCSGTLVNANFTITAGQCVEGARLFSIRLGSTSLTADHETVLRLATDKYYIHEEYNPQTLENDLGLIEFRMAITFSVYIQPIMFLIDQGLPDGSQVITLGWGQTSDGDAGLTDDLMYVDVVILSNEECRLTYGSQIIDNMVCVEGNYNEGTCNGDLGSPLFQYGPRQYKYLVGISSFVSGNGCESTDPSGFTRYTPYREWARSIVNNITINS